jgi:flagellar biosynthesis protein FliR
LFPGRGTWPAGASARIAEAFSLAFVLAAPFTIVALLNNVALGAINRAMPQLMVAFVGAPAIVWSALALLALATPDHPDIWSEALDRLLAAPFGAP